MPTRRPSITSPQRLAVLQLIRATPGISSGGGGGVGPAGPAGPAGPPITYLGDWSAVTSYAIGDAVFYASSGSSYISKVAANLNHIPDVSPTQWGLLAQGAVMGVNYDSGLIAMPAVDTLVTAVATKVEVLLLVNLTTELQAVTVTDNAGAPLTYVAGRELEALEVLPLLLGGLSMAGVRWHAANAGAVNAQVRGYQ